MEAKWTEPPEWLAPFATAVLNDLQGDQPIQGLHVLAARQETGSDSDVFFVGLYEADGSGGGGGLTLNPTMSRTQMLLVLAEVLQERYAETAGGWGQSRPPCPYHPHPARPAERENEAWWVCGRNHEALHRIGDTLLKPSS